MVLQTVLTWALVLLQVQAAPGVRTQLGRHVHALELVHALPSTDASVKVLCWVNTYDANHARAQSIKATWGRRCDKIVFMSNVEDRDIPTVRVVAPPTHLHLWQKHRDIVRVLWREYGDSYDWIFKCDDDTYVLVDNLRHLLASYDPTQPLLLGHRMTLQWWELRRQFEWLHTGTLERMEPARRRAVEETLEATRAQGGLYYTPGGGGYAFSAPYLKLLVESLDEPYCLPDEIVPDDWAISFCMRHHGIEPVDTRDAQRRERFHQYSPERIYFEPHDPEAFDHTVYTSIYQENNWFSDHFGIGWQNGSNCAAPDTVSFHYIKPPLMEVVEAFYYPPTP
ncbi:glycoprotein-N-acetylgalactosamine 3-beta-galactosyltransferase [Achlya hypogyna]|uniref:N-acetylgalactosaminide beta-1,3-galactosyltransferase n=1 Tax=Achlya hypogyna TaxID=1202772 RepID=A0A1V9YL59_ACHHY|nr:glycoprotein-N-acetylgalactosamine 3-beta-galactosyltransferase [Achlya hypogyna]